MSLESLLFASHGAKFFTHVSSLIPPNNPVEVGRMGTVLSLFHGYESLGSEKEAKQLSQGHTAK